MSEGYEIDIPTVDEEDAMIIDEGRVYLCIFYKYQIVFILVEII